MTDRGSVVVPRFSSSTNGRIGSMLLVRMIYISNRCKIKTYRIARLAQRVHHRRRDFDVLAYLVQPALHLTSLGLQRNRNKHYIPARVKVRPKTAVAVKSGFTTIGQPLTRFRVLGVRGFLFLTLCGAGATLTILSVLVGLAGGLGGD